MTTTRRLLLAIPFVVLAGAASMFFANLIDAPPAPSFWLGIALCSAMIGWRIWQLRHY